MQLKLAQQSEAFFFPKLLVESEARTYHGRVGPGRKAGRRGGATQDGTPTEQYAQETSDPCTFQGIDETMLECFSRSTNKRNQMREQNLQLTTGFSAVYQQDCECSSFLAADQWTDALLSL